MRSLKQELAGMFKKLEKLCHLLSCVEENEQRQDNQEEEIKDLQEKVAKLATAHRAVVYKMDDLGNRKRRNNLCLRGIPKTVIDEDLQNAVQKILNPILGQPESNVICFDRSVMTM